LMFLPNFETIGQLNENVYRDRHAAIRTYDREPAYPYKSLEIGKKIIKSSIFWDITPCSPLKINRCFGGTYSVHL
jgi:hypothetical protein